MRNTDIIGKTFVFYGCKAWTHTDNSETTISGLFMIEDIVYSDRTCGQWESGFWVFPVEYKGTGDGPQYFVDEMTFIEQTDPQGYGRMLVQERETENMAEWSDRFFEAELATLNQDDIPF